MTKVRYGNTGAPGAPSFTGWYRATVDEMPALSGRSSADGSFKYLLGESLGGDIVSHVGAEPTITDGAVKAISLYFTAAADARTEVELNSLSGAAPTPVTPTAPQIAALGTPTFAGIPLTRAEADYQDGMFWRMHWRGRISPMINVDVWLWWEPSQGWLQGSMAICASNPSVPDYKGIIPPNFRLEMVGATGGANVWVPGLAVNANMLNGGYIGDLQARGYTFVVTYPTLIAGDAVKLASAQALIAQSVSVNGIKTLWPRMGNPRVKPGLDVRGWIATNTAGELSKLHNWTASSLGVILDAHGAGAEGDQIFVGAQAMAGLDGLGGEHVLRMTAFINFRRVGHVLEADGTPLAYTGHPNLSLWDGRPHNSSQPTPDYLGKPLTEPGTGLAWDRWAHANGWSGYWVEHFMFNSTAVAYRLTGDPALDWELDTLCRYMWYAYRTDPETFVTGASLGGGRSAGYECLAFYHLSQHPKSSDNRLKMAQRGYQRIDTSLLTSWGFQPANIWDVRYGDSRLIGHPPEYLDGTGRDPNWLVYQQAEGSYFCYKWCHMVNHAIGRQWAYDGGRATLDRAFSFDGTTWTSWHFLWYQGTTLSPLVQGAGAHHDTGSGIDIWFTPMFCAQLLENPEDTATRQKAVQWLAFAQSGNLRDMQWVPPEMWDLVEGTPELPLTESSRGAWRNVARGS